LSAKLTKTHSFRLFFLAILLTGDTLLHLVNNDVDNRVGKSLYAHANLTFLKRT